MFGIAPADFQVQFRLEVYSAPQGCGCDETIRLKLLRPDRLSLESDSHHEVPASMIIRQPLFAVAALVVAFTSTAAFAATADVPAAVQQSAAQQSTAITKEQATEMALKAHPGKVTKVYADTKKGKKTWEVKITGDDGKKWEVYYEIATGELVAEEAD